MSSTDASDARTSEPKYQPGLAYKFSFTLGWQDQKNAADQEAPRVVLGRASRLAAELAGLVLLPVLIDMVMLARNYAFLLPVAVLGGCWLYFAIYPILIDL